MIGPPKFTSVSYCWWLRVTRCSTFAVAVMQRVTQSPFEFYRDLWRQKTQSPWAVICRLGLAVVNYIPKRSL